MVRVSINPLINQSLSLQVVRDCKQTLVLDFHGPSCITVPRFVQPHWFVFKSVSLHIDVHGNAHSSGEAEAHVCCCFAS